MILVLLHAPIARNGSKIVMVAGIFHHFFEVPSRFPPGRYSSLVYRLLPATQFGCARQRSPINIENAVSASLRISWMATPSRSAADRGHKGDLSRWRPPEATPSAEARAGPDFCGFHRRRYQRWQRILQLRPNISCFFITIFIGLIVVGQSCITSLTTSKLAVRRGDVIGEIRLRSSHKRPKIFNCFCRLTVVVNGRLDQQYGAEGFVRSST